MNAFVRNAFELVYPWTMGGINRSRQNHARGPIKTVDRRGTYLRRYRRRYCRIAGNKRISLQICPTVKRRDENLSPEVCRGKGRVILRDGTAQVSCTALRPAVIRCVESCVALRRKNIAMITRSTPLLDLALASWWIGTSSSSSDQSASRCSLSRE